MHRSVFRPDDTFGFDEFRKDLEDAGMWAPVRYYSRTISASGADALAAATVAVARLPAGE